MHNHIRWIFDINKRAGTRAALMKNLLFPFFFLLTPFLSPSFLYAQVNIKVSAKNPSEYTTQTVLVKTYMPRGIKLDNVIEMGDLKLGYDVRRGQYYVHKNVLLKPQEIVNYNVVIEDIWLIDTENLEELENHTDKLVQELAKSEYKEAAQKIQKTIVRVIGEIMDRQEDNIVEDVGAMDHVNAYVLNQEALAGIKEQIGVLEKWLESLLGQGQATQVMGEQSMGTASPEQAVNLSGQKGTRSSEGVDCSDFIGEEVISLEEDTVVLNIVARNPSDTERSVLPLRYVLAKEVKAGDVVNSEGLKVGFDFEQEVYYMFDNQLILEPAEKRTINVVLKNKWKMDRARLFSLKIHVESMLKALKKSKLFKKTRALGEDLLKKLEKLLEREEMKEFNEEYVTAFREDQGELTRIQKDIVRMEEILKKAGMMPKATMMDQKKVCEEANKLGINTNEIDITKSKDGEDSGWTKDMKLMSGGIFKGQVLSSADTWKIIQHIVTFLLVISGTFYFMQIREKKSIMFDSLTGVFTRAYIFERLKEELKIAWGAKNKCSLLILDVDKFKTINDTYGHVVGDTILKEFIVAIRKVVRATDLIGRFGGDEFLVVLPTTSKVIAKRIAEEILQSIRDHKIYIEANTYTITASIGAVTFPDDSRTAEDLFSKADKALYQTKRQGRDGVTVFGG